MARKLTNNSSVVTIGLDVGYGFTKGIMDGKSVMFPSVTGYAHDAAFQQEDLTVRHPGDQLSDEDGDWYIGDLALMQLRPGEQLRLRGRTANESTLGNVFRVRMAKVAMSKLLPGRRNGDVIHVRLATGLPVSHMGDSAGLKEALIGQHRVQTDIADFVANVSEVMVMPQAYGCIYSHMLTERGEINPCHTAMRTGVVDIGTYTVDVALDDNGEYVDTRSGSVEGGVYLVHERIAKAIERDFRHNAGLKEIEAVLRTGCFKASGELIDYGDEVAKALEPLRSTTMNLMNDRWKTATDVDVIYVSGGGASLVFGDVKAVYPQSELSGDAQMANARGYLNYATFKALS